MSSPFIGEIRITTYSFVHLDWAQCDGQSIGQAQNSDLFLLLGYTFGGGGSTFALPDLRGRIPVGMGNGGFGTYSLGAKGGTEQVSLSLAQLPAHSHAVSAVAATGNTSSPSGARWAGSPLAAYSTAANPTLATMDPNAFQATNGSSSAHENRMPSLALNFQIALTGIWPQRP